MATKKKQSRNTPHRRALEKKANAVVGGAKRVPKSKRRQRNPTTKFGFKGFGMEGNFAHEWSTAVPAAIGNVTETPNTRHIFKVRESELVSMVYGNPTALPDVLPIYINPARVEMFPWLSGVATKFELYRFRKLSFRFQPSTGTTDKGVVTIGIDYDPVDTTLATEQQLVAIPGTKTGSVYTGFTVDAMRGGSSQFAKDLFVSDIETSQIYNLGRFYIMVSGTTSLATDVIGRLYVDYECDLIITQISVSGALDGKVIAFAATTGITTSALLGTDGAVLAGGSGIGTVDTTISPRGIYLYYPGTYVVIISITGTGLALTGTSTTFTPLLVGSLLQLVTTSTSSTTQYMSYSRLFTNATNVALQIAMTGTATSMVSSRVVIIPSKAGASLNLEPPPLTLDQMVSRLVEEKLQEEEDRVTRRRALT